MASGASEAERRPQNTIVVSPPTAGWTPFSASVQITPKGPVGITEVSYVITPRARSASRPVTVTYSQAALAKRQFVSSAGVITLPLIGLYSSYNNQVTVTATFSDNSFDSRRISVVTPAYATTHVLQAPNYLARRSRDMPLGFDFMLAKSTDGSPVTILDSDGYIRWVSQKPSTASVLFRDNGVDVGSSDSPMLRREELDGGISEVRLADPLATRFHHDLSEGPRGLLAELDLKDRQEDYLAEIAPDGTTIKQWDMVGIISTYMQSLGDDYRQFTRPGPDWFHMNSAIYDASDRSVIISSRENFVIKMDYETGSIKWILGDTDKYWSSFPALRAKALTLQLGGLSPIGQHSLSLRPDGQLLLFDNGYQSLNMPEGEAAGTTRGYSAVRSYKIDPSAMTASMDFTYDDDRRVYSSICSSAYLAADGSMLVTYSHLGAGETARIKGLDPQQRTIFDFSYPTGFGCTTSWNTVIVPFGDIRFN